MEHIVVTLAPTTPNREVDVQTHTRQISDALRSVPGLLATRCYASREHEAYLLILTTWEDMEAWQKARTQHNPKQLLQSVAARLLLAPPKQWLMHYLWGYSRPAASPTLAAAQFASVRADQADAIQQSWMESLRRQAMQPLLAFGFLARGTSEENIAFTPTLLAHADDQSNEARAIQRGSVFLNLQSWANEGDQEEYYTDQNYQSINRYLSSVGAVQRLALELV